MNLTKTLGILAIMATVHTAMPAEAASNEHEHPTLEDVGNIHTFKAPLYWSIYERAYELDGSDWDSRNIPLSEWEANFDWVAKELKPHGYDMICTDGFLPFNCDNGELFMTRLGQVPLKDLIRAAKDRGLRVGIYDSPLEAWSDKNNIIPGTQYTVGSLLYDESIDKVLHPEAEDKWHTYIVFSHPGAKEYVDEFFRHYSELGVDMIRMDFLSWFEDGYFRFWDTPVGKGYGRQIYADALAYVCKKAREYGIFLSLVMPHLYNDAEIESRYGNMVRIVNDTMEGGWGFTSAADQGKAYLSWPTSQNQFDGFTYWSRRIAGRDKVILDGDFTIMHSYTTPAEKEFAVSIQLMAGGPIAVTDQYCTIGEGNVAYYTNDEMLALNKDRFVGHPLDDTLMSSGSNIWYGQMSNGDYVVGFFNRDDQNKAFSLDLADIGIKHQVAVRDLWKHSDEGRTSRLEATVEPHGCKIMRLRIVPDGKLYMVGDATAGGWDVNNATQINPSEDNPDVYIWEGELKGAGTFKILTNLSEGYDGPTIHPMSDNSPIGRETVTDAEFACYAGGNDYKWRVEVPATYRLSFNIKDFTMSFEFIKETEIKWPEVTPIRTETLYLIGQATPAGWNIDNPIPCTKSGEGNIFVYEGELNAGTFRATTIKEYGTHIRPKVDECEIGPAGYDGDFTYVDTPDYNWKVTEPGNYRLTFDLDNWTVKAEKVIKWPDVTPIQTETLYLIGDATPITGSEGWDIDQAIPCTKSGEGNIFVYEGHLKAGVFRATTTKEYGTHIRPKVDECEIGSDGYDGDFTYVDTPDYNWKVTEPGNYRLTFDLDNWTIKAIKWPDVTPIQTETLYLIGSATPITGSEGWDIDQAIPCTKSGEGNIFVYDGHLNAGIFRATTTKEYGTHIRPKVDECEIGPAGYDGDFTYVDTPDYNWKVTEPGNYRLTFDLDNWTIKAIKWPDVTPIQTETLYLIGSATPITGSDGWDINEAIPCTKSGEGNIFVYEGELNAGIFRATTIKEYGTHIRPKVDECEIGPDGYDGDFTYVDTPDYNWKVTEPGNYRLTFDLDNWTVKAEKVIKWPDVTPIQTETLYLIGSATPITGNEGWDIDQAIPCTKSGEGNIFVYDGHLNAGIFRATTTKEYGTHIRPKVDECEIGPAGYDGDFTYVDTPDYNWKVTEPGNYRLTFDLDNWTIKVIKWPDVTPIQTETLYLVGSATPITGSEGWDIDQAIPCTKSGEGNIFVYDGDLKAGKFRAVANKEWGIPHIRPKVDECEIGPDGYGGEFTYVDTPDYNWKVTDPGKYRLTFDLDNWTIKAEKNVMTGIDTVVGSDSNQPCVYYNLNGARIEEPVSGFYIVKQGDKVSKVIIR